MSWLKPVARNISRILVTLLVFHDPMFWLKLVAPWNIYAIFVTALVFHVFQASLASVGVVAGLPTLVALRNILVRSIVASVVKMGASLAVTCMLLHP